MKYSITILCYAREFPSASFIPILGISNKRRPALPVSMSKACRPTGRGLKTTPATIATVHAGATVRVKIKTMIRAFLRSLVICAVSLWLPAQALANIPQVKHVVIIVQENRTPDNIFHGLDKYLPGVDIANSGDNSTNNAVLLTSLNNQTPT